MGRQTYGGGISERETVGTGGRSEEGVNIGSADYSRPGGHVGTLTPAPAPMVTRQEDVDHGPGGEEVEVPDGLHHRDRSSSLLGCVHPGPLA